MKTRCGILAAGLLLLMATSALAQSTPKLEVSFGKRGYVPMWVINDVDNYDEEGEPLVYHLYVLAYYDGLMGGAAFKLGVYASTPPFQAGAVIWPSGSLQIGNLLDGVEFAWTMPQYCESSTPILICEFQFSYDGDVPECSKLWSVGFRIEPFTPKYEEVLFADQDGNLRAAAHSYWATADPWCPNGPPVADQSGSWSSVKSLYR